MARPRKNIDPEQVRKLAGWGLTQNDIASLVGCSLSLISLRFSSSYDLGVMQSKTTIFADGSFRRYVIKRHRLPPLGKSCTSHRRSLDCGRAATSDLASSPARSFQL